MPFRRLPTRSNSPRKSSSLPATISNLVSSQPIRPAASSPASLSYIEETNAAFSPPCPSHATSTERRPANRGSIVKMEVDTQDPNHHLTKATGSEARPRAPVPLQGVARTAKRSRSSSGTARSSGSGSSASRSRPAANEPSPATADYVDELTRMIQDIRLEEKTNHLRTRAAIELSINDAISETLQQEQSPRRCISIFRGCIEQLFENQRALGESFGNEVRVLQSWIERMDKEIRDERRRRRARSWNTSQGGNKAEGASHGRGPRS